MYRVSRWPITLLGLSSLTVAGQTTERVPAPPSDVFRLDLIGGVALHSFLRTRASDLPRSGTVYRATLVGGRYYQIGLSPAICLIRRALVLTVDLPITYETTHTYQGSRPIAEPYGRAWPAGVAPVSSATLRANYLAVRGGLRVAFLPTHRVRPFVGGQLGHTWALRIRENVFSQDNPYGWAYQGEFLGGPKGSNGLGHLTAAALAGVEIGMVTGRVLAVGVRAESGIRFQLFDSVQPVWRAVSLMASYSLLRWPER